MMERRRFMGLLGLTISSAVSFWSAPELEIRLYDVEGQSVFPVFGPDAVLTTEVRSFLLASKSNRMFAYGFDPRTTSETNAKVEFQRQIKSVAIQGKYARLSDGQLFEIA